MSDADAFLRLAFAQAHAAEANSAIDRIRIQEGDALSGHISYEFILPSEDVRTFLLDNTLPRLVNFLESRGAKLPACPGVFLSVFSGDSLFFIRAADAIALLSEWSGLSIDELRQRYGPW